MNQNSTVPGQRIKGIKTFESNSAFNYIYKKYVYKNDDDTSSGITTYYLPPSIGSSVDPTYSSYTTNLVYSSNFDENVRYSKVTEEITGKEKNEFYFTDLITNPDSIAVKKYSDNLNLNLSTQLQQKNSIKISKKNERGKLYKTVKYDANMYAVFTQTIKYTNFLKNINPINEISPNCTSCKITDNQYYIQAKKVYFSPNISGQQSYYIGFYQYQPVLPYLPISVKTTEGIPFQPVNGSGGKLIDSEKYFTYNTSYLYWHPYPTETIENLPHAWSLPNSPPVYNGKIIKRIYYPHDLIRNNSSCIAGTCPTDNDLVGGKFSIYKYMIDNNTIIPIVEATLNENSKPVLKEYIYIKDATSGNLLKMSKRRESLLNSSFTLSTPSSATVEEKETFQLYDNIGNLLQSKTHDAVPMTTIYGYKQGLPIAEIKGATYSQIMQAYNLDPNNNSSYLQLEIVKKSDLDTNGTTEADLISALNNFKSKPEFSDFQISTYTYDPLIGVTNVIHPSGIRETYLYDTANRLEKVVDANGKILKEYKYNYKN